MTTRPTLLAVILLTYTAACGNGDSSALADEGPWLVFDIAVDATQARLGNLGQPAEIPEGHAAQSPDFALIGIHYVELAPTALTPLGQGEIIYQSPTRDEDGAIVFASEAKAAPGDEILRIPLAAITSGEYAWIRVSLAYQEYDLDFMFSSLALEGRLASFVGVNTYIESFTLVDDVVEVNAAKPQGFWAFHTDGAGVQSGQAPAGATTVPNPIADTSPIPANSCVVTGPFDTALQIPTHATEDMHITLSLSSNQSFEWLDDNGDGLWQPLDGELVVDMGIRGLMPMVK